MRRWTGVDVTSDPNPTLARRRLAVRLRALRERDERSLSDLAGYLSVSLAQASRLDTGARGFKAAHVEKLADWYAVKGSERDLLESLAAESQKRAWWQQVDLPDSYRTLIGLEQAAESINEFGGVVLPGLLQTYEYALAAANGSSLDLPGAVVEQAVGVRMRRQEILERADPPMFWSVIDEALLARTTGGEAAMAAQLDHLLAIACAPRVTLQVVGFEAGTHLGGRYSQFILLEMAGRVPDTVYQEGLLDPTDSDDPVVLRTYQRVWDMLRAIALDPETSRDRIMSYRSALVDHR
jgi:transcriptional regulator with XRE-family HTH domain